MLSDETLRDLAFRLLELSKRFLKEDKSLDPMAFIVTQEEHFPRPLDFQNEARKMDSCKSVIEEARARNAAAIVTIFTARGKEFNDKLFDEDAYFWGKFQSEPTPRCILLTVTGPNIPAWAVEVPFEEKADTIVFGEPKEYGQEDVILGFSPGWPTNQG